MTFRDWMEVIGDALILAFVATIVVIFWTIYIQGSYGIENNPWILHTEMIMGLPILFVGGYLLVVDIKQISGRK